MAKEQAGLMAGFSDDNVVRIYHGEPALVGARLPTAVLGKRQLEAVACHADGLTQKEVAEVLRRRPGIVRTEIQAGFNRLQVRDSLQLAGYFPLGPEHDAIGAKTLAPLQEIPRALDILEAISVGKRNRDLIRREGGGSAVRRCISEVEGVWEDVEGGLMLTRVANAIRARYVLALEGESGTIEPRHVPLLTLPRLAKLEPRIHEEFPQTRITE